jgi:hypothetical protein
MTQSQKAGLLLPGISCVVFFVAKSKHDCRKADSGYGVGPVRVSVQADFGNPPLDDSGVLPGRQMRRESQPTRKQIVFGLEGRMANPGED